MKKEINVQSWLKLSKEEYDNISEKTMKRLIESFPSRHHQWIEKEGDRITY